MNRIPFLHDFLEPDFRPLDASRIQLTTKPDAQIHPDIDVPLFLNGYAVGHRLTTKLDPDKPDYYLTLSFEGRGHYDVDLDNHAPDIPECWSTGLVEALNEDLARAQEYEEELARLAGEYRQATKIVDRDTLRHMMETVMKRQSDLLVGRRIVRLAVEG